VIPGAALTAARPLRRCAVFADEDAVFAQGLEGSPNRSFGKTGFSRNPGDAWKRYAARLDVRVQNDHVRNVTLRRRER
jgi:hypothetical protein